MYGMGRIESAAQRRAAIKNLKKARAAKKAYQKARHIGVGMALMHRKRGGFAPFLPLALGTAQAVHGALQASKPVSFLKNFGNSLGISLPKNKFGEVLGKIGKFAIDKLGYGRRKRGHHRRRRHY